MVEHGVVEVVHGNIVDHLPLAEARCAICAAAHGGETAGGEAAGGLRLDPGMVDLDAILHDPEVLGLVHLLRRVHLILHAELGAIE